MKHIFCLFLCLILCICCFGCTQNQSAENSETLIFQLENTMHFTTVFDGNHTRAMFDAPIHVTVTDYPDQKDIMDIYIDFPEEFLYTFDHPRAKFTITQEDQNLPYYCAEGDIYYINALELYVMAIDFEKEYLILQVKGNTKTQIVASTDPNADPLEIHAHFSRFLEIYHYPD